LEEINQLIQGKNGELKRILQVEKDEKYKLRLMLEKIVEKQVGECSTTEEGKNPFKTRPTCFHDMYIIYCYFHENVYGCTCF
jgi:hypothetical protein